MERRVKKRALRAEYIYNGREYMRDYALVYGKKIEDIVKVDELSTLHPSVELEDLGNGSILYPGFINTHVHLEFSSNTTQLRYGDFLEWLYSVIEKRERVLDEATKEVMSKACMQMLESGVTGFGAISSYGLELEVCRQTPQRVTFFNELIGSIPSAADALYADFRDRVERSFECAHEERITPAIAVHAPYSVHPVLLKKAVSMARERGMPLSTHFMESRYEREWLDGAKGGFAGFFEKFFNTTVPVNSPGEFLRTFDGYPSLFVHCTHMNEQEMRHLEKEGHHIAHCPRSNRLLGCGRLPLERISSPLSLATDGLSSNYSLNIFDELKAALMMHSGADAVKLSEKLMRMVTSEAASAIASEAGVIERGAPSDFALVRLPSMPQESELLALHTILHVDKAERVWIAGEECL